MSCENFYPRTCGADCNSQLGDRDCDFYDLVSETWLVLKNLASDEEKAAVTLEFLSERVENQYTVSHPQLHTLQRLALSNLLVQKN